MRDIDGKIIGRTKNPVKTLYVKDKIKKGIYNLSDFPNFSKTGGITGMRRLYYGLNAKLIRCGSYIYNVDSQPEIYDNYAH